MNKQIIVARCRESLAWLDSLPSGWEPIVYDKGDPAAQRPLPNIGREAHTYLHHIVSEYDRLEGLLAFVQGAPLKHCKNLLERLTTADTRPFTPLCNRILHSDESGAPNHKGLPIGEAYQNVLGKPFPGRVWFGAGAQFVTTGAVIRMQPHSFWARALNLLCTEYSAKGPWIYERLWKDLLTAAVQVSPGSDDNVLR